MADETKPNSGAPTAPGFTNPQPTIEIAEAGTVSVADLGSDGQFAVDERADGSDSWTAGEKSKVSAPEAAPEGKGDETAPKVEETPVAEAPSADTGEALPDFTMDDQDVVAAYEQRYMTTDADGDQVLNFEAFSQSLLAARDAGEKIDISVNERAFLKKSMGISDRMIDDHIAGIVAKGEKLDAEVFGRFGGEEGYGQAVEWASKGGYKEAQHKAYNDAIEAYQKTGDRTKLDEQIELLEARYKAANPDALKAQTSKTPAVRFRDRRPSSPAKQAGKSNTTAPKDVFKSSEEHRIAQAEAYASQDAVKMKAVSDKLRRSMEDPNFV